MHGALPAHRDDVLDCASFDDTIGVNGWPLEQHVAGDVEVALAEDPGVPRLQPAALPHAAAGARNGVDNLLVAGPLRVDERTRRNRRRGSPAAAS